GGCGRIRIRQPVLLPKVLGGGAGGRPRTERVARERFGTLRRELAGGSPLVDLAELIPQAERSPGPRPRARGRGVRRGAAGGAARAGAGRRGAAGRAGAGCKPWRAAGSSGRRRAGATAGRPSRAPGAGT